MSSLAQCELETIETLQELTAGWDNFEGQIDADTSIINDLGFESLDVVYLVSAIEQRYGRRDFPFEQLLMVDGRYVDDLSVKQIAEFLQKHL